MDRNQFDEAVYEDYAGACEACDVRTVENEIVFLQGLLERNLAYPERSLEAEAERGWIEYEIAQLEALIPLAA